MTLSPDLNQALVDAADAGAQALTPEDAVERPGGRSWRRNPRHRAHHQQRPRAYPQRDQTIIVTMTHRGDLALHIAALARPEPDWATAGTRQSWFRRVPGPLTVGGYRLQEVHGDAGGSFPGVVVSLEPR